MKQRGKQKPETRAERNIRWIETHCFVPEGAHVGESMVLRPWQKEIIRAIYDGCRPDGTPHWMEVEE